MQVKKQQLQPDMKQKTASKSEKEYNRAVYCHPASLPSMLNTIMWYATLDGSQAGIKTARK